MQELLLEEESSTMPDKPIDMNMLSRVDSDQKATQGRVDSLGETLNALAREVSEVKGSIKAAETPWWIKSIVAPVCVTAILATAGAVIHLEIVVAGVETFIHDNGGLVIGLRLQKSTNNPITSESAKEAQGILVEAKKAKTSISPEIVADTGMKFVAAAPNNPDAWSATLAFLGYKSFINHSVLPGLRLENNNPKANTHYYQWQPANWKQVGQNLGPKAKIDVAGVVPREQAAIMAPIGTPSETSSFGNRFVLLHDGEVLLDHMQFRHVVISNAHVHWGGNQVIMQDVYFINCTFELPREAPAQRLALAILQNLAVDFQEG